jgi:hypothetical protein
MSAIQEALRKVRADAQTMNVLRHSLQDRDTVSEASVRFDLICS